MLNSGCHLKGSDYRFFYCSRYFLLGVCVCVWRYLACWICQDLFARNPTQTNLKPTKGNVLAHLLALLPLIESVFLPFNYEFISWCRLWIFFCQRKTTFLLWHCRSQMWSEGCCLMLPKEFITKITSKFQHLIYFMTSKCIFVITIHILSIRWSKLIFIIFTFEDKGLLKPLEMKSVEVML